MKAVSAFSHWGSLAFYWWNEVAVHINIHHYEALTHSTYLSKEDANIFESFLHLLPKRDVTLCCRIFIRKLKQFLLHFKINRIFGNIHLRIVETAAHGSTFPSCQFREINSLLNFISLHELSLFWSVFMAASALPGSSWNYKMFSLSTQKT